MNSNEAFDWLRNSGFDQDAAQMNAEAMREARLRQVETSRLFFDVFGTGRGPELLQWLRDRTIEVSLINVSGAMVSGEIALSPADWAYIREGQNSLIREIERQLLIAKTPMEGDENGEVSKD